jgi:hypothetical protein
MKKRRCAPAPVCEIIPDDVDVILPKSRRGRPRKDDSQCGPKPRRGRRPNDDRQWIDLAKEGLRTGKYKTRNHAARVLSKDAKGACPESTQRRLNDKFKKEGID